MYERLEQTPNAPVPSRNPVPGWTGLCQADEPRLLTSCCSWVVGREPGRRLMGGIAVLQGKDTAHRLIEGAHMDQSASTG
ncbi:hypothetical protein GCM10010320_68330 [Streptomyces caelestis]|nr:hypothetical protein GCM10010320_68330 [Streptomyces caelestis]